MLPTKLNPLGLNYDYGYMEFEKAGNLCKEDAYIRDQLSILEETDEYIDVFDKGDGLSLHNGKNINIDSVCLNPDTTYSFSIDIENISGMDNEFLRGIAVCFYYSDPGKSRGHFCDTGSKQFGNYDKKLGRRTITGTITTKSDVYENEPCKLVIRTSTEGVIDKDIVFRVYKHTAMVVKGDIVPTSYEPYNSLYRCYGESTQYQNSGKNLLNLPDGKTTYYGITCEIKDNRVKVYGTARTGLLIKITNGYVGNWTSNDWLNESFLPAGTYTMSVQNKKGTGVEYYPSIRALTPSGKLNRVFWYSTNPQSTTFTVEEPIASIDIHVANGVTVDCEFNVQIEAGSTMTEWKPYTDIPTPSIDNPSPILSNYPKGRYKTNLPGITVKLNDDLRSAKNSATTYARDYVEVDIKTQRKYIIRECYKYEATGEESCEFYTSSSTAVITKRLSKGIDYNRLTDTMLNTHSLNIRWSNTNCNTVQVKGIPEVNSAETFKTFLRNQRSKGTPLTYIYALATPTTTYL